MHIKDLIKKIKANIVYFVLVLCSIYISFLIYNAYSVGGKASLIIVEGLILISILLGRLFYKNIDINRLSKKNKNIVKIITVFVTFLVLICDFSFFTNSFKNTKITIVPLEEKNEYSNGNNITINSILRGNNPVLLDDIKVSKGWKHKDEKITAKNTNRTELNLSIKKSNHAKIIFDTNVNSGKVKIIDGDNESVIDLYSYKSDYIEYNVQSNSYTDFSFIIKLIASFAMIYSIVYILLYSCYYLYQTKKSIMLPTLLLIGIIRMFYYSKLYSYTIFYDSTSYMDYDFAGLLHLIFPGRTPIYPLIISIFTLVVGTRLNVNFVVLFQILISFIAVIYFYKTMKLTLKNKYIISVTTLLYAVTPAIMGYDNCILTESLALSGYVFFIYNIIKYIKQDKLNNGVVAVIIAFILTFLRPTSLLLVGILFVFLIARFIFDKSNMKNDIKCFIASTISVILIVIYANIFYQTHQLFTISDPMVRQEFFICIDQGFYKASSDKEFVSEVSKMIEEERQKTGREQYDKWEVIRPLMSKYGNVKIKSITSECKKNMRNEYIKYVTDTVKSLCSTSYDAYSAKLPNANSLLLNILISIFKIINFSVVYLMIVIEFFITLYKWIKNRQIPWIDLGLFGFSFVIVVSSIIGTNAEFARTSVAVIPFIYISLAKIIEDIQTKINGQKT